MDQAQLELQLKVWKELAISKQMLLRTAAESLKLDPDCTQEQLKQALEAAVKKVSVAEANLVTAQDQSRATIASLEKKLNATTQAQATAEASVAELTATRERTAVASSQERTNSAKEIQKLKDQLAGKDKELKAINAALADTPENVIKKMKALRKEKQDEADSRRTIEASLNALRKEKREQDALLNGLKESSAKLVTQHKALHEVATKLHEAAHVDKKDDKKSDALPAVPDLDTTVIEAVENPGVKPDEKKDNDKDGREKGKNGKKGNSRSA